MSLSDTMIIMTQRISPLKGMYVKAWCSAGDAIEQNGLLGNKCMSLKGFPHNDPFLLLPGSYPPCDELFCSVVISLQ